ncbi:MAG: HflK protein [Beggiatoa sp. IS2]|nr:MAG: HflK protein [Beggiatoa sp. IS2]
MAWNEPGGNGSKDPWGHRKHEQGPPDLDEIVKKMRDKLGGIFGDSGGNGGDDRFSAPTLGFAIIVILIVWGFFGFYIVQPAEQGVEMRFGQYTQMTLQGLHWHIPYPIEKVKKVNVEQVQAINHKALMLTQDENIVSIRLVVQYRIKEASDYLFNVAEPDKTLQQATETALRSIVGTSKMDDVLTSERERVAADTKELIQTILDRYKTGLTVASVNMQDAQPPDQVQEAFADVIKAREDEERSKNKAEAYSNEVVQKAIGTAEKLRQDAQGYKAQVIAQAEGQTQRFLSILREYEKAPAITRKRLYLETLEFVLGHTSKILVDVNSGNNLMVLPLDRLFSQLPASNSSQPAGNVPANPPTTLARPTSPEEEKGRSRSEGRNRGDNRSRGERE